MDFPSRPDVFNDRRTDRDPHYCKTCGQQGTTRGGSIYIGRDTGVLGTHFFPADHPYKPTPARVKGGRVLGEKTPNSAQTRG